MGKYGHLRNCNEFSMEMEAVPYSSKKIPLAVWIDYYLWKGGKFSDVQTKILEKTQELSHGGYNFPGQLFNSKGTPKDRTFLGHIAARIINEEMLIEIDGNPFDSSMKGLSLEEKNKKNVNIENLYNSNAHIRIEGFMGERRLDSINKSDITSGYSLENYLPGKEDIEKSVEQVSNNGKATLEDILNRVKKNVTEEGKKLKNNWRMLTQRNIEIWFK